MEIIKALVAVIGYPASYILTIGAVAHYGGQVLKYLIA